MSERPEELGSARGGVPADQPEVAAPGIPVEEHDRSHQGEPIPLHGSREAQPRDLRVIGTRQRKTDGLSKSTGRARYTDDITLPGMLHGKILRSPHPHARIVSIDTSEAEALPGVHATVVGSEMPIPFGIIVWTPDEHALATDRVRYIGDAVAAVAAIDEETANRALDLIRVEYEVLEPILDPFEAARRTDVQIHEPKKAGHNGNISKIVKLEFGEVESGLAAADVVVEGEYFFEGRRTRRSSRTARSGSGRRAARRPGGSRSGPHPGAALPAPGAGAGAGARPGQGTGDPAAGGRRVRWQERAVRPGVLRRPPRHEDGAPGEDPLHARGGVLRAPRAAPVPHALPGGRDRAGRDPRRGRAHPAGRRSVLLLRPGHHLLLGAAPHGTVPDPRVPFRFHSRLHQQAGVWTQARARQRAAALRLRGNAGQARRAARDRPDRAATPQLHGRDDPHRQRAAGDLQRLLECLERVERASGWKSKHRRLPFGRAWGSRGAATSRAPTTRSTRTGCRRAPCSSRWIAPAASRSSPAPRHRAGVGLHGGVHRVRGAGRPARLRAGTRLRHRPHAGGSRRLLLPRHLHARQRLPGRRAQAEAAGSGGGRRGVGVCTPAACSWRAAARWTPRTPGGTSRSRGVQPGRGAARDARLRGLVPHPKDVHGEYRGGTIGASPAYSFTAHVAEVEVDPETGSSRCRTSGSRTTAGER
jgi:hypothetical protein